MASPFAADLGRVARNTPRAVIALPRSLISRRWILIMLALCVGAVAVYMLWFRHSSLVAADEVDVSGVSFSEPAIRTALTEAGEGMSTLEPDIAALERAVRGFPTVASISVEADFPHRLAIEVDERAPVAIVGAGEGVPVAADGTVLTGVETGELELPAIESRSVPASGRLRGVGLAQTEILGAAPDPLRPAIRGIGVDGEHGVEVALAGAVELRFGDSRDAAAKWAAAAAILADPKLDQISYIDLRLPGRPAVGGAPAPVSETEAPEESIAPAPEPIAPVPSEPAPTATETPVPAPTDPAAAVPPESTAPPATPAPATGVAGSTAAP
jgi:cell division protein FtsQ